MIEADQETVEIARPRRVHLVDELLRSLPGFLRGDHDRRAVRVLGSDEVDLVSAHLLEPHPDVGLDVFHDVADMQRAVGVRERCGDEQMSFH